MKVNIHTLSYTDRTSWARIAMAWKYYFPALKKQMIWYPIVSLLLTALTILLVSIEGFKAVSLFSVLSYMIYLGPVVFAMHREDELSLLLPVLRFEKCIVVLLYSFIVVPLLVWIPQYGYMMIMEGQIPQDFIQLHMPTNADYVKDIVENMPKRYSFMNLISLACGIAVTLWAVMAAKSHRAIIGIAGCLGFQIAISIISGAVALIYWFNSGVFSALSENPDSVTFPGAVSGMLDFSTYILLPFITVCLILFICLACRAIYRKQI